MAYPTRLECPSPLALMHGVSGCSSGRLTAVEDDHCTKTPRLVIGDEGVYSHTSDEVAASARHPCRNHDERRTVVPRPPLTRSFSYRRWGSSRVGILGPSRVVRDTCHLGRVGRCEGAMDWGFEPLRVLQRVGDVRKRYLTRNREWGDQVRGCSPKSVTSQFSVTDRLFCLHSRVLEVQGLV